MIKADPGWVAVYKSSSSSRTSHNERPIIAWDDDGNALVVEDHSGELIPARLLGGIGMFAGVRIEPREEGPYIGVVPGQGWFIRTRHDDGAIEDTAVVAFAIRADGTGDPLMATADGLVEPVEYTDGEKHRLNAPGGWDALQAPPDADSQWMKAKETS